MPLALYLSQRTRKLFLLMSDRKSRLQRERTGTS